MENGECEITDKHYTITAHNSQFTYLHYFSPAYFGPETTIKEENLHKDVRFLPGNSSASEFYTPTFRNILSLPSS
jgi:hypothetical protein